LFSPNDILSNRFPQDRLLNYSTLWGYLPLLWD